MQASFHLGACCSQPFRSLQHFVLSVSDVVSGCLSLESGWTPSDKSAKQKRAQVGALSDIRGFVSLAALGIRRVAEAAETRL